MFQLSHAPERKTSTGSESHDEMTLRELDSRTGEGFEVTLLWSPESGQLAVVVVDEIRGEELAVEVEPDEALDAFRHPYAYLSVRRPEFRRPLSPTA
jgi:hypothetical protein